MTQVQARRWIADLLRDGVGQGVFSMEAAGLSLEQVAVAAQREGVVGLVHARLAADSDVPALADAVRRQAARTLWIRSECRRLLDALAAQGIAVLVLKGGALVWWLYPAPHLRDCGDLDLLFASREEAFRALDILAECGYAEGHEQGDHAYELLRKPAPGVKLELELDVHWRLLNAPVFADVLDFRTLLAGSIAIPALGPHARGLGPVHALLHAAMNRVVNLYVGTGEMLKCLYDIHLLSARFDDAQWESVLHLAIDKGLCGVLHEALQAARVELGTMVPGGVLAELARAIPTEELAPDRLNDWIYMQRRNAAALPLPQRIHWLWHRLVPDANFLRQSHGADASFPLLLVRHWRRFVARLFGGRGSG